MTSPLRVTFDENLNKRNPMDIRTDEHFAPKLIFWEQLQFLVPTMEARQSRDTLKFDKDSNQDNLGEL
jgi:hypothetical protein